MPEITPEDTPHRWRSPLLWLVPAAIVVLLAAVLAAMTLRQADWMQSFFLQYPGSTDLPAGSPVGFPAWLGWQHFLNSFLILLIIRTGWVLRREQKPADFWIRNNSGFRGTRLLRTKGKPKRFSLQLWFHLSLDVLWSLNGVVYIVLLFVSGQWVRIVPTRWEIFPNALSAGIQYLSLNWPTDNGWVNYNSLQVLSYFVTVFVAAPLAIVSGIRLSPAWPLRNRFLRKLYPVEWARAVHFPAMLWFVFFIVIHLTLVLATGALRNLGHMYAGTDEVSWLGFWIFAGALVVMIVGWVAARPSVLRKIAALGGTVSD
jgi:thiosulfate reductase cytochrome b subunit